MVVCSWRDTARQEIARTSGHVAEQLFNGILGLGKNFRALFVLLYFDIVTQQGSNCKFKNYALVTYNIVFVL
jgi:hypothetical protein